jgi:hypothetical protein
MSRTLLSLLLVATLCFTGCDNDDPDDPGNARQFTVTVENVGDAFPVLKSGAVASPGGPDAGPAIFPGESATFSFTAPANTTPMSGMRLNLATMFVQSNDLFYAFPPEGLALYDASGTATTGDVTDQLVLYDAGTEEDTAPGTGPDQKPAQDPTAVDQGADENETVQPVESAPTNDFEYPETSEVIRVTLAHDGASTFTVTVENVSTPGTVDTDRAGGAVPLSPVVWAAHTASYAMFEVGEPASPGLEILAEDGFPADVLGGTDTPVDRGLADELADVTGVTVPLSPGAYAVHADGFMMFEVGSAASVGIERVAEDGMPMDLVAALQSEGAVQAAAAFNTPEGASEAGPIGPGGNYAFTVDAMPGDRLNLATMFVQSNDFYYAFAPEGLSLFTNGVPISGDQTAALALYDAGTEGDEEPGVGSFQAIRQPAPNTGPDGEGANVLVGDGGTNDGFAYPANADVIRVTITPQ